MKIIFVTAFLFLISCNYESEKEIMPRQTKPVVILQPLEFSDTTTLLFIKSSVETFYEVDIIINSNKSFPNHLYYKPRSRYRADRIIHWLRMNIPDSARTTVGITSKDVSSTKGETYDYGLMGLGYRPGKACVVSSFRPAKTVKNKTHLQQRLLKLVIHEMGHNFGLHHCTNEECYMVDAEGQMKLDKEKYLCEDCKRKIKI